MDTYGTIIAPNTIRFERLLPGPIERVWAYLTEPDKRAKWLATGAMDLRVGGDVLLSWTFTELDILPEEIPEKYKNGHSMKATITRCEPPYLLGFTWGARAEALSEVVFELTERGKEVLLTLTHHRLPNQKDLLGISGGWHAHLGILTEHLNGRTANSFWGTKAALDEEYKKRSGEP